MGLMQLRVLQKRYPTQNPSNTKPIPSVVRAYVHDVMCCLIDSSWWTNKVISHSIQCSTTGITKAVVYAILSMASAPQLVE